MHNNKVEASANSSMQNSAETRLETGQDHTEQAITPTSLGLAGLVTLITTSCGGGSGGGSTGSTSSAFSSTSSSSSAISNGSSASSLNASSGSTASFTSASSASSSSVAPVPDYTPAEAARFLLQAQFTATDQEIAAVKAVGYESWLNAQFNAPIDQTGAQWLTANGHATPKDDGNYFNPVFGDWMAWNQLFTGTGQVRKRLSLALSEFFVVSLSPIDGFWPPMLIAGYWDLLNAKVFSNFRNLLEDISLNPAMGFFLNTKGNLKEDTASGRQPDENYAREIMQLFSIGLYELNLDGTPKTNAQGNPIETYVQSDITNLARVFTGYDWDYSKVTQQPGFESYPVPSPEFTSGRMKFDANKHSKLAVSFLGTNIPANTSGAEALRIALDTLFNHANTGPFFCKQMIQRLVTSNPSPAYVQRVASAFNNNGSGVRGDLKAVWRAILTDTEARGASTSTSGKLREPIVRLTQIARTFNVSSSNGKWEIYDLSNADWGLGQAPLRSPSVFNFFRPGYVPPNTVLAQQALLAPEFQLHNETSTAGYINFISNFIRDGYSDVKPSVSILEPLVLNRNALVDWLNLHLTANQLSAATLELIKTALEKPDLTSTSSLTAKNNRLYAAILLVVACPEYLIQK